MTSNNKVVILDGRFQPYSSNNPLEIGSSVDNDPQIKQALTIINGTYGDIVSVEAKAKDLNKFGRRVTVGTGWETLMTAIGSETEETILSTNAITHVVSTSVNDTDTINVEYHTISGGDLTFGVQSVTLAGSTPVALTTPCARVSRMYNTGSTALEGSVYAFETSTRTDAGTHAVIPAGEQQTQKAATSISSSDYWLITGGSVTVLSKVTKYAEFRLEIRPVGTSYWRPISQTVGVTDTTGTIYIPLKPYGIVPPNSDIRIAVRTNTSGVDVAGGFEGYLAIIQ